MTCIQKVPCKNIGLSSDCTVRCFVIFTVLFREVVETSQFVAYSAFSSYQKLDKVYSSEMDVNVGFVGLTSHNKINVIVTDMRTSGPAVLKLHLIRFLIYSFPIYYPLISDESMLQAQ
jgi:hypothetical protein